MSAAVETALRGPEAYAFSRRALEEMESAKVWPTPLNYELWLHFLSDPESALGREMRRILDSAEPFTDATADMLAAEYLPRGKLTEEIRDAGRVLDRELASVSSAIARAHRSHVVYGETLDKAAASIEAVESAAELQAVVGGLTTATRRVQRENETLEKKLDASTREVARLREHLEQVRRDAMTDALTNLANRKAFDEHLTSACAQAEATGHTLTLAVLDIDHFKRFNDTWGHQTGDQVLRYVASVMGRTARPPRIAARYGGEEFAMVFPRESRHEVETALEEIRREISSRSLRRRSTNDDLGAVTLSVGFASRLPGEDAVALLGRADAALYASKRGGRNQVTSADRLEKAA
ncbi:diguanylate cyclase [Brevundimonas sp. NPDC092305]|uniref:GGDEF domain-containing protein n=1 Tax=Brevundimonas sp. NPDC092305 TaxID=3363957 RepID=UPI0038120253